MNQANIILTGFMGTGKSTVGRLVARRTGRDFVDTDELIERQAGVTVAEIFAARGEGVFREMEAGLARQLAGQEGLVIASGGRLMLDPVNALHLARNGLVVCLAATPGQILDRLGGDDRRRPLLEAAGVEPLARIEALLAERAQGYGQFARVDTGHRSPEDVADEVLALAEQMAAAGQPPTPLASRLPVRYPGGEYQVVVSRGLLGQITRLAPVDRPVVVVSDENVAPLHAGRLALPHRLATVSLPPGEAHKTLDSVQRLYEQLLSAGLDRGGAVLALGGGVVGDTAGFAAATYMRGVALIHCPTTLLAMVDASVGGKTGVDLPQGKNLVGAFKQPEAVLADLDTLETLPPGEFAAGMAEVIKAGLIGRPALFERLAREPLAPSGGDGTALQLAVVEAILVKRDLVEADPFEAGRRRVLNLGHTFAHAIEQVSRYRIPHGQAVAMGLVAAAGLAARLGHCSPELAERIAAVLAQHGLPAHIPADLEPDALIEAMGSDKKKSAGRLHFVLIRRPGDVFVSAEVSLEALRRSLAALRSPLTAA
jgi:shikimate kinase / 3-dehydroquinate synthase